MTHRSAAAILYALDAIGAETELQCASCTALSGTIDARGISVARPAHCGQALIVEQDLATLFNVFAILKTLCTTNKR